VNFAWDSQKADANLRKHGVSFSEAQTVFDDPHACIFDDRWHSVDEHRELIIGYSSQGRLLIVSFTERPQTVVRIISSRQATSQERKNYEQHARF
jgi:uncharacterized DUF497 family protein